LEFAFGVRLCVASGSCALSIQRLLEYTQEEILSRHFQSNQMRLINICGVNFRALAWGFAPETLETTLHVRKRIPGSALHPALGQPGPLLLKVAEVVPTKLL